MRQPPRVRHRLPFLGFVSGLVLTLAVIGMVTVAFRADRATRDTEAAWTHHHAEARAKTALLARLPGAEGFGGLEDGLRAFVTGADPALGAALSDQAVAIGIMLTHYRRLARSDEERFAVRALEAALDEFRDKLEVAHHMIRRGVDPNDIAAIVQLDDARAPMALEMLREAWENVDAKQRQALSASLARVNQLTRAALFVVPALILAAVMVTWLAWRDVIVRGRSTGPPRAADVSDSLDTESLYRELVEGSLQGILIHDDFKPLYVNRAFVRLFDLTSEREALALNSVLDIVDESCQDDAALMHRKIAAGEVDDWWGRLQCRTRDGTPLWVEEMVKPVRWRGRQVVLMTLLDITDRVTHEEDREMERSQTERQAEEVVALAEELDAALKLAEEQKVQLHRLSISDPLTGAFNRRHFMDRVDEEIARMKRQPDHRVSLMLLDLDHFKGINDTHGHSVGDETLRRFTRACRHSLRENDVFGRLGGEEFSILLPNTAVVEAESVAERLRLRTRDIRVSGTDGTDFGFTVSIGVAEIRDPHAPFDDTLNRADAALYASKAGGRDRVTLETALTDDRAGRGHASARAPAPAPAPAADA